MLRGVMVAMLALWIAGPAVSEAPAWAGAAAIGAKKTVKTKPPAQRKAAQRKAKTRSSHDQPMQVVIVRSSEKGCEPSCQEWIMAEGMIAGDTPKMFFETYERAKTRNGGKPLPVILHSQGGNILAALQIGHFLRARTAGVAVGQTQYASCGPFSTPCAEPGGDGVYHGQLLSRGAVCLSACPLILASGVWRVAGIDTAVGVHHWGFENPPGADGKPAAPPKKRDPAWDGIIRNMISGYLTTMGISLDVMTDMDKTPFARMKLYDFKQRKKLKLVTETANVERVMSSKACKAKPIEGFCNSPAATE